MSVVEALELRTLLSASTPTAPEQEMLEWINHMRTDPQAALSVLVDSLSPLHSSNADIQSANSFFHLDGAVLAQQWALLTPRPPLAWNSSLADAARSHSQLMIAHNAQEHQLPGEASLVNRIVAAGYANPQWVYENIYAYASSVLLAHAAFAIDWGNDNQAVGGMQNPPDHRNTIMDAQVSEIGVGIVRSAGTDVGPLVVTQDYASRYNLNGSWLLGVVYHDGNGNVHYTAGEGLAGVSVHVIGPGVDQTIATAPAGGYQLLLQPGDYTVQFSGPGMTSADTYSITVATQNVKLDKTVVWNTPTNIALNKNTLAENLPPGTVVGALATTDLDAQDTFTYSLVTGAGSTDNSQFRIVGTQLRARFAFDYESQDVYQIRVQTTDSEGLSVQKRFLIQVDNLPEPLLVTGTAGSDVISLTQPDSAHVRVTINGAGADYLSRDISSITIDAADGSDTVSLARGIMGSRIVGGPGNDTLRGGNGSDTLLGGLGDDLLNGKAGDDVLKGSDGNDRLMGGNGNDRLIGGLGNDTLTGGAGSNYLAGSAGNDRLYAGTGPDTLMGGDGNDWFYARNGLADFIDPGIGHDRAQIDIGLESAGSARLLA